MCTPLKPFLPPQATRTSSRVGISFAQQDCRLRIHHVYAIETVSAPAGDEDIVTPKATNADASGLESVKEGAEEARPAGCKPAPAAAEAAGSSEGKVEANEEVPQRAPSMKLPAPRKSLDFRRQESMLIGLVRLLPTPACGNAAATERQAPGQLVCMPSDLRLVQRRAGGPEAPATLARPLPPGQGLWAL